MKYFYASIFLLSFFTISSVEQERQDSDLICCIARLPIEIRERIVFYLELSTSRYESESPFERRLRAEAQQKRKAESFECVLNNNQRLLRNDRGSLELITQKKNFEIRKKLVYCSADQGRAKNALHEGQFTLGVFTPSNHVDYFRVTPDKKKVVAMIDDGFFRCIAIDDASQSEDLSLQPYYQGEGTVRPEPQVSVVKEAIRIPGRVSGHVKYETLTQKMYATDGDDTDVKKWVMRYDCVAGGNGVVFCNGYQVFLCDDQGITKKYELSIKLDMKNLGGKPFIKGLACNSQGTKFGVIVSAWYDAALEMDSEQAQQFLQDPFEQTVINDTKRLVYRKFYTHHKEYFSGDEKIAIEDLLAQEDFAHKKLDNIFSNLYTTGQVKDHFVSIELKREAPLTLQEYFAKRGVCKDLLKQGEAAAD